jgi:hypothetical protein
MDASLKFTQYAKQVSVNAELISTCLKDNKDGSVDTEASTLSAAKAKLAEAAFELLTLSRDTGSFLVHLTVDVCAPF